MKNLHYKFSFAIQKITHTIVRELSAVFYAAYGFTGAFGRNLCTFTFPQCRRNLRKSLLDRKTYERKKGQKMAALKITLANA